MPEIARFSHMALSVRDLAASTQWYCDVLGFGVLEDITGPSWIEKVLVHPSGPVLSLHQHASNGGEVFDPTRTGMDHFALLVPSRAELDEWERHLTDIGVEHSPVIDKPYGSVLSVKDPDRTAVELFYRENHP
jgi:glyoxylase I family protein